jgi:hypothetical protein
LIEISFANNHSVFNPGVPVRTSGKKKASYPSAFSVFPLPADESPSLISIVKYSITAQFIDFRFISNRGVPIHPALTSRPIRFQALTTLASITIIQALHGEIY